MSPEGLSAATRRIELRLAEHSKSFQNKCSEIRNTFAGRGTLHSSMHASAIKQACEDELLLRAQMSWEVLRLILDAEGFVPSEDNSGQIRIVLDDVTGRLSADVAGAYRNVIRTVSGTWPELTPAREHAVEATLADVEIDLIGRKTRRPPLEDELSAPRYGAAREHWRRAIEEAKGQPANRPNAVKEAVHAIESLGQIVVGKSGLTLGDTVKELRSQRRIPVGADRVIEGLWAFANSAPGARHGSALPAHVDESHWDFVRTTAEGTIRLLLDIDAGRS